MNAPQPVIRSGQSIGSDRKQVAANACCIPPLWSQHRFPYCMFTTSQTRPNRSMGKAPMPNFAANATAPRHASFGKSRRTDIALRFRCRHRGPGKKRNIDPRHPPSFAIIEIKCICLHRRRCDPMEYERCDDERDCLLDHPIAGVVALRLFVGSTMYSGDKLFTGNSHGNAGVS